jgi:hypothetical protein
MSTDGEEYDPNKRNNESIKENMRMQISKSANGFFGNCIDNEILTDIVNRTANLTYEFDQSQYKLDFLKSPNTAQRISDLIKELSANLNMVCFLRKPMPQSAVYSSESESTITMCDEMKTRYNRMDNKVLDNIYDLLENYKDLIIFVLQDLQKNINLANIECNSDPQKVQKLTNIKNTLKTILRGTLFKTEFDNLLNTAENSLHSYEEEIIFGKNRLNSLTGENNELIKQIKDYGETVQDLRLKTEDTENKCMIDMESVKKTNELYIWIMIGLIITVILCGSCCMYYFMQSSKSN